MPTERYTIGPKLLGDIRQTITRVDAIAPKTSGPHQEPRLQTLNTGLRLYRGTFTQSTWAVGSSIAVTIEGTTETVSVTNYCVPIKGQTDSTQQLSVIFGAVQGTMSVLEVQQPTCTLSIGGLDLTQIPNYSQGVTQVLGHLGLTATTNTVDACYHSLRWFTVTNCGVTS